MTKKELSFFRIAKNISQLSNHPKYKLGAVVVHKHNVISTGYNNFYKSHPIQQQLNKKRFEADSRSCIHAEVSALLPLINRMSLADATIYVYREHKNGTLATARPCKGCMSIIRECGIKKIYYTTEDGYAKELLV